MMASSGNIVGLDFKTKAALLHHMLHGPTIQVKDIFKFALSGAVCTPKLQLMSEAAWKIWKKVYPKDLFKDGARCHHHACTINEHAVPVEVLYRWLLDNKDSLSINDIANALKRCQVAVISKDEDKQLNAAGLRNKMPVDEFDVLNDDPLMRYKAINLKLHVWSA